jgi:hypothetical protein
VKGKYNKILSGSRLAPAAGGLGRDDELLHRFLGEEEIRGCHSSPCAERRILASLVSGYDHNSGEVEER